jgi:hypothetical protein
MERAGIEAAWPAVGARTEEAEPRYFLLAAQVRSFGHPHKSDFGVPALSSLWGRPKRGVVPALKRVLTASSPCRKLWPSNKPMLRPFRRKAKGVAVAKGGG